MNNEEPVGITTDKEKSKKIKPLFVEKNDSETEYKINGINIIIQSDNMEESKKHIKNDYDVIQNNNLNKIILEKFIPWLKGTDYLDRDNQKVLEGLKLYEVTYDYIKICAEYSPTGEDGFFGHFEFCFESGNDYTSDMLEAAAMEVFIYDKKIVKVGEYDI